MKEGSRKSERNQQVVPWNMMRTLATEIEGQRLSYRICYKNLWRKKK